MARGSKDGQIMKIRSIVLQLVGLDKTREVSMAQVICVQLSEEARMKNERAAVSLIWLDLSQGIVRHPKPLQD